MPRKQSSPKGVIRLCASPAVPWLHGNKSGAIVKNRRKPAFPNPTINFFECTNLKKKIVRYGKVGSCDSLKMSADLFPDFTSLKYIIVARSIFTVVLNLKIASSNKSIFPYYGTVLIYFQALINYLFVPLKERVVNQSNSSELPQFEFDSSFYWIDLVRIKL